MLLPLVRPYFRPRPNICLDQAFSVRPMILRRAQNDANACECGLACDAGHESACASADPVEEQQCLYCCYCDPFCNDSS